MKFSFTPLEKRVLLDAALAISVINVNKSHDDAVNDNTEDFASIFSDADADSSFVDSENIHILVVSSDVDYSEVLISSVEDNVEIVKYNPDTTSLMRLAHNISDKIDGHKAASIAFATHGTEGGFALTEDISVTSENLEENTELQNFWQSISGLLVENGRIDILACNTNGSSEGEGLISALEALTQVNFAASDDITGQGGNWTLESDNIAADEIYFKDNIQDWQGSLGLGADPVSVGTILDAESAAMGDIDGDGDVDIVAGGGAGDDTLSWFENDGSEIFTENNIHTTGDAISSIAIIDLDQDGHLDILTTVAGDNAVRWYENDGAADPSFTVHTVTTATLWANDANAADMDGDGDLDIVAATFNDSDQRVVWFENDGSQNFGSPLDLVTGAGKPTEVDLLDFDGDGDNDIVYAAETGDYVAWLENDGETDPSFTNHTIGTGMDFLTYVEAADFDGDGDLDVVARSLGSGGEITLLENDGDMSFTTHVLTTEDVHYNFIAAADMDNDGDLDIVTDGNYYLENRGDLNFSIELFNDTNYDLRAVGDLDGDGDIDVIAKSDSTDLLYWYENTIPSSSALHTISTAVDGAVFTSSADFDNDGDMDLVSAANNATNATDQFFLHLNDGNGNFTTTALADADADNPTAIRTGDLDGDGDIDIAVSSSGNGGKVGWYTNDGSASFTFTALSTAITTPQDIFAADINNDGDLDLIVASFSGNALYLLDNDGSGSFGAPRTSATATSSVINIDVADINQDGYVDIVVPLRGTGSVVWYENDKSATTPTFTTSHDIRTGLTGDYLFAPVVADIDGDGDPDVVATSREGNTIEWYKNDGSQNFSVNTVATGLSWPATPRALDYDLDGDIDLVVTNNTGDNVLLFRNDGAADPTFATAEILGSSIDGAYGLTYADLDGDGDQDIAYTGFDDDTVGWIRNDTPLVVPNFNATPITATSNVDVPHNAYSIDVDQDGDLDLVVSSYDNDTISWYENVGNTSYTEHVITTLADGATEAYAIDLDGDGDIDILSSGENDADLEWYENDGSESFTVHTISSAFSGASSIYAYDIDQDGDIDVVAASFTGNKVSWFENNGSESFSENVIDASANGARDARAVDVDQNGTIDIIAALQSGSVVWYSNDGNQSFTKNTISSSADVAYGIRSADMDNDGDIDVISTSYTTGDTVWYENDGSESFSAHTITDSAWKINPVDIDQDGDMDLMVGSGTEFAWYENNGGFFTQHIIDSNNNNSFIADAADVDGDGDIDVIRNSSDGSSIIVYTNNDAPVLTAGSVADLTGITEDATTSSGDLVSAILGSAVADTDFGASEGIAIYTTDNSNGTWQYSVDAGSNWSAIDTVSTSSALLLRSTDKVRFVPDAENSDSASISFYAWDQASGTQGSKVDVTTRGDTTAFSTDNASASIAVSAVNDAPVLTDPGTLTLYPIPADETTNVGDLVSDIVGSAISDVDSGAIEGIAVYSLDNGNNKWQYSTDAGSSWTDFGTPSTSAARLLRPEDKVRFVPDGTNADTASITFYAWDQDSGSAGGTADVTTRGTTTPFSTANATASITVNAPGVHKIPGTYLGAKGITSGDFDNDGDIDLVGIAYASDQVVLFANDGSDRFTSGTVLGTEFDGATMVRAVDLNQDGRLDIVVASSLDNEIGWYENDGSLSFTYASIYASAGDPADIEIADLDNDGDLDIVSSSDDENNIYWFDHDDGAETFTTRTITTTSTTKGISIADIDQDGDLDIAAASYAANKAYWYESNGAATPTFTEHEVADANNIIEVQIVDLDKDGDADIIGTRYDTNVVEWYENDGVEVFSVNTISTGITNPSIIDVVDYDLDGDLDIAVAASGGDAIQLLRNDAHQTFSLETLAESLDGASSVHASDIDGDGDFDLAFASLNDNTLGWIRNTTPEQTYAFNNNVVIIEDSDLQNIYNAVPFDIDLDGDMDFIGNSYFSSGTTYYPYWLENTGDNETFTLHNLPVFANNRWAKTINPVDMDSDGDIDLAYSGENIGWYENNGSQTFTLHEIASGGDFIDNIAVDFDNDGDIDLVTNNNDNASQKVLWYQNDGSQNFSANTIATGITHVMSIQVLDFDLDGDYDVLTADRTTDKVSWHENDNLSFTENVIATFDDARYARAADIDGDGDMDVFAASNAASNNLKWYEQTTDDQTFTANTITTSWSGARDIAIGDIDNDGDVDVAVSFISNHVAWYDNDGQTFTEHEISYTPSTPRSINIGDVDRDGDLDLVLADDDNNRIVWLQNVSNYNAPDLTPFSPTMTAITEDNIDSSGMLISAIVNSSIEDTADSVGIAIYATDNSEGSWEYSTDSGSSWTSVATVSTSSALLLESTDYIRFVPDTENADTATFSYCAWDQTSGSQGDKVAVTTRGASTAFSSHTDTATMTTTAVNDAPTVDTVIPNQNASEDSAFSYQFPADTFADVDDGDSLTYSASGMPDWLSFETGSRTFSGTPDNDDIGTVSVTVTADDGDSTVSDTFDIVVANSNDAPTLANPIPDQSATEDFAFSYTFPTDTFDDADEGDDLTYSVTGLPGWLNFDADYRTFSGTPLNDDVGSATVVLTADDGEATVSDTFNITIANINDAPSVDADQIFALSAIDEDNGSSGGTSVDDILSSGDSFSDVDTSSLNGMAVTSTDNSNGIWQYSVNSGADWNIIESAAEDNALLLNADALIRFVPEDNHNGSETITFKAWDQTSGTHNTYVDTSADGGTTAYSADMTTAQITVNAVNDLPVLSEEIDDATEFYDLAIDEISFANTFEDIDTADASPDVLTYTATLDDGSAIPSWLTLDTENKIFHGTPQFETDFSIILTATDNSGANVETSFYMNIYNPYSILATPSVTSDIFTEFTSEDFSSVESIFESLSEADVGYEIAEDTNLNLGLQALEAAMDTTNIMMQFSEDFSSVATTDYTPFSSNIDTIGLSFQGPAVDVTSNILRSLQNDYFND